MRGLRPGGGGAAPGRHPGSRSSCCPSSPRRQLQELVRWHLTATAYSAALPRRSGRGGPRVRGPDGPGPPQGGHRHAPRRRPPSAVVAAGPSAARPCRSCAGRGCGPTWPEPTRSTTPTTVTQLALLDEAVVAALEAAGYPPPIVHAANSAGAWPGAGGSPATWCAPASPSTASPRARRWPAVPGAGAGALAAGPGQPRPAGGGRGGDLLRSSHDPRPGRHHRHPAARLRRRRAPAPRRRWAARCCIGGRRRPIAGVVTMDQLMVDCGDDAVVPGRRGRADRRARAASRSRLTTGPAPSGPSPTRWCAALSPRLPRLYEGEEPEPA